MASTAVPRCGRGGSPDRTPGASARAPSQASSSASSARAARCRAGPAVRPWCRRARRSRAGRTWPSSAGPAGRCAAALPVDEGAGLLGGRGDRQDDVGAAGDLAGADLEADDERGVEGGERGGGVGQVGGVDAADDQATEAAGGGGGQDARGVAARRGRQRRHAPDRGDVDAGGGVGDRAAAGKQRRQRAGLDGTALAGAAGHPGETRAGACGQAHGGGEGAGDRGQPLADEDDGAARRSASVRSATSRRPGRSDGVEHLGLGAGRGRRPAGRPSLVSPRVAHGATETTSAPRLRTALRSRRKTIGDSSSGSRPARSTTGACSRSA